MIELMDEYGAPQLAAVMEEAARAALDAAGAGSAGIEIVLVGDAAIRRLNRQSRGVDAATDVLSFPMLEYRQPLQPAHGGGIGRHFLGSVVISLDRLYAQAAEYRHSRRREAAFLATHGVLHLLGYDHALPEQEAAMRAAQEAVLAAAGLSREQGENEIE